MNRSMDSTDCTLSCRFKWHVLRVYMSLMPPPPGYGANIDIVSACIYGAVPCTDTKLLATAAQLRSFSALFVSFSNDSVELSKR
jgi:hypothetical protein